MFSYLRGNFGVINQRLFSCCARACQSWQATGPERDFFLPMHVKFWGVRGSIPRPTDSEELAGRMVEALYRLGQESNYLDLSNRDSIRDWVAQLPPSINAITGGNTPCVEVRCGDELFIIDFGSGLRALGQELMQREFGEGKGRAHLFLSHLHHDHIQGWPFFRPAYIAGNQFELYARHGDVREQLAKQQQAPFFPPESLDDMLATVNYHQLCGESQMLCDGRLKVTSLELDHPSGSYAFRFEGDGKTLVYASDGAFPAPDKGPHDPARPFIEFFRDADLVIIDAQFSLAESLAKRSWGHSSAVIGVELAAHASAKRLALFHHDPGATDAALEHLLRVGREYAANPPAPCQPGGVEVFLAREGVEIEL